MGGELTTRKIRTSLQPVIAMRALARMKYLRPQAYASIISHHPSRRHCHHLMRLALPENERDPREIESPL